MKKLTKRQKAIETQRQLRKFLDDEFRPELLEDIKNILKNVDLPDDWLKKDNEKLCNFIIDKYCVGRPLETLSEMTKQEFDEIVKKINP